MERINSEGDTSKGEINSSGPIIEGNCKLDQEFEAVNKVFSIPLLLDKILRYSVHKSDGKQVDKQTSFNIRLVNKNWLWSASRTLKTVDDPLIQITVGMEKGKSLLNQKIYETENGNLLEQFLLVFSKNSKRSSNSILPLTLSFHPLYFTEENKATLQNVFEQCGDMLCKLNVRHPSGTMTLNWDTIKFPNLQTLQFSFHPFDQKSGDNSLAEKPSSLIFLQESLQNSKNLKHFNLENSVAVDIPSLNLPKTLESLRTYGQLTLKYFTVLQNNKLPNVELMDLHIRKEAEVDVMFKILEHFGKQLRDITLRVAQVQESETLCIRFPLLENLRCLRISGKRYCLSPQLKHVWPKLVPNVKCLVIDKTMQSHFEEFVQGSQVENVTKHNFLPKVNE